MPKTMFTRPCDVADIEFYINGTKHRVSDKFPPTTTLNDYIREVAGLTGTKVMCKEAGCGCCAVAVTHASNGGTVETMSINSCLCPLYSVDGWQITTTEGLGSQNKGFHPIQKRIADYNGTQCGYCTPGFVMSMYGLLHQVPQPTMTEIEASLDGHVCRCTGYRSILDAMKSFGVDSPNGKCADIEDLNKNLCPKTGEVCRPNSSKGCHHPKKKETADSKEERPRDAGPSPLEIDLRESRWYRPLNLKDLGKILQNHKTHSIKMVFGNTSEGIFKHQGPFEVYIDLRAVNELYLFKDNGTNLVFGAGTTIGKFRSRLLEIGARPGFHYFPRVVRHLNVLASVLVRNAGSMAGNLMIKHANPWFPSDLFTMLETIGAKVEIFDSKTGKLSKYTLMEFLRKVDMRLKVVAAIEVPNWNPHDHYRSFKITPRWQNAHAYVNAAFKIPVDKRKIVGRPSIVLGGINGDTVHAGKTEAFLENKVLNDSVVSGALKVMYDEIQPEELEVGGSVQYRRQLAVNLLYKTLLEVFQPMKFSLQSGAASLERPLSSGIQTFQKMTDKLPVGEALPKKTAPLQASGEAIYTDDIPAFQHELKAAVVLTTVGVGKIARIDTSEALKIPGVVGFIGADDIPTDAMNNFIPANIPMMPFTDELFITENFEYIGKTIGLILAETQAVAERGARAVKVTYKDVGKPILDVREAMKQNTLIEASTLHKSQGDAEAALKKADYVVSGEIEEGNQYHFYIENQVAVSVPSEDGMDVYVTTQAAEGVQRALSQCLGKPMNYFNVVVNRLGGGFGGKGLQSVLIGAASAVAAEVTGRPVRLTMDLASNMVANSKRFPILAKYRAGCDKSGKLVAIVLEINMDVGHKPIGTTEELASMMDAGYFCPNWDVTFKQYMTNKVTAGAVRGPGQVPACLIIETVLEHLSREAKQSPLAFRELNLIQDGDKTLVGLDIKNCTMRKCWDRLKQTADIVTRVEDVDRYNKNNLWRKRGITMTAVKYDMHYELTGFASHVSIFANDGTVTVFTAGVEMGQGLYMKVAQAVAYRLGIPLDYVKVKPNNNNVTPNPLLTGGSVTSERSVASAMIACDKLNERLQPVKEKFPGADWKTVALMAFAGNAELVASGMSTAAGDVPYSTYMVGAVETEVDVLTGEFQVKRVDLMADFGESMNPTIDIGQIEGAFVMGLGAYLTEDLFHDKETGKLLNDGTWEYKPPTTKDIPIDWRIHLLPDTPNKSGILSSKAVGEPPIGLAMAALLSIKRAVESVREDVTGEKTFLPVSAPFTVEKAQMGTGIQVAHLHVGSQA